VTTLLWLARRTHATLWECILDGVRRAGRLDMRCLHVVHPGWVCLAKGINRLARRYRTTCTAPQALCGARCRLHGARKYVRSVQRGASSRGTADYSPVAMHSRLNNKQVQPLWSDILIKTPALKQAPSTSGRLHPVVALNWCRSAPLHAPSALDQQCPASKHIRQNASHAAASTYIRPV
jgi:hypothetical protein